MDEESDIPKDETACPSSFGSRCQKQDSNPSLSKNPGLFPPHNPGSFSKSAWEMESKRENWDLMAGKGPRKMSPFSLLCVHTDPRSDTRLLMSPLCFVLSFRLPELRTCSWRPDCALLWTLSSLQDSWNSVLFIQMGFSGGSNGKETTCDAGDPGLTPGSGWSHGKWNGPPRQSSCLEKSQGQGSLAGGCSPRGHTESAWAVRCAGCWDTRGPRYGRRLEGKNVSDGIRSRVQCLLQVLLPSM